MAKADVQRITDSPIASFENLQCLLPRGRYSVEVKKLQRLGVLTHTHTYIYCYKAKQFIGSITGRR